MKKYSISPVVLSKEIHGKQVVLEDNVNYYRELNEVASAVWEALRAPKSLDELVRLICKKFAVDISTAQKDIIVFLKKYLREGFLEEVL